MKIDSVKIYGLNESIVASGFPMVDSYSEFSFMLDTELLPTDGKKRAEKLSSCGIGEGHDNFLCGITVQANITAPRFWWPEFQRYHFAEIVSATSTMHRLKKFAETAAGLLDNGLNDDFAALATLHFSSRTDMEIIMAYIMYAKEHLDDIGTLKANLPEGYLQTARITTNYRQLKTIYRQRKTHRLAEWKMFCAWVEKLPFNWMITGEEKKK